MTDAMQFNSAVTLSGPWRTPVQMLAEQSYGDHASIHDSEVARSLGFKAATIERPTHFSQFDPLAVALWGRRWFETGYISAHFHNAAFDGDRLQASATLPHAPADHASVTLVRDDGAEILRGTMGVGRGSTPTALEERIAGLTPLEDRVILTDVQLGERSSRRAVRMEFDRSMGQLYPFSLASKLAAMTEPSELYDPAYGKDSPWGGAIIPVEMISVLMKYTDEVPPFAVPPHVINLFADMEIRLLSGPLFVGEKYEIDHEVEFFSGSKRTESMWVRTRLYASGGSDPLAEMLLNTASLKESYIPRLADSGS